MSSNGVNEPECLLCNQSKMFLLSCLIVVASVFSVGISTTLVSVDMHTLTNTHHMTVPERDG